MKKVISILVVCSLMAGCSPKTETDDPQGYSSSEEAGTTSSVYSGESETTSTVTSDEVKDEPTSSAADTESSESKDEAVSSAAVSTVEESESKVETSTVSSAAADKPSWIETAASGTMYVNTNGIYSRKDAVMGSATIKLYNLNAKVSVVAVTNTDYYKLDDGSFIHKDYLSSKETVVSSSTPSSSTGKPSTPTVVSADAEKLLNGAKLSPMKTNDAELDAWVENTLGRITNSGMSTYQKVKAVYDYIINNYVYGRDGILAADGETVYASYFDGLICECADYLIKNKKGICYDYASLFVVMTRAIGLESYVVSGTTASRAGGFVSHTWAIIKLNGEYYVFDSQIEQGNLVNGQITYYWFCKSEESMSSSHIYGSTGPVSAGVWFYRGEPMQFDNARDLAIGLFGNFELDEQC